MLRKRLAELGKKGEAEGPSPSSLVWPLLLQERESSELALAMDKSPAVADENGMKKDHGRGQEVSDDTAHQISTGLSACPYIVTL